MAPHYKRKGPQRPNGSRSLRRYLIVSEDSKSGLDYLRSFPVDSKFVEIVAEGGAGNTVGVVDRGIERKDAARKEGNPFAHVYRVFDKDDWDSNRYQAAFERARQHNDLTAIWANECFELWYLLHFEYRHTSIRRHELPKMLEKLLGIKYSKGDGTVHYKALLKNQKDAIANSKRLLIEAKQENGKSPWRINPSTNIHALVQQLNALAEIGNE